MGLQDVLAQSVDFFGRAAAEVVGRQVRADTSAQPAMQADRADAIRREMQIETRRGFGRSTHLEQRTLE